MSDTNEVFVPIEEVTVDGKPEEPDLLDRTEEKIEDAAATAAHVIAKPFRFIGRHVSSLAHATAAKIDRTNDIRRGRKELMKFQLTQMAAMGKAARAADAEK